MDLFIAIVPVLVMSLYMMLYLRRKKKHDTVLYRFCNIRREVMSLIREGNFNLSREDYINLRELAEITNLTIHNYNEYKNASFPFLACFDYLRRAKRLDQEIQGRQVDNQKIAELYKKVDLALVIAVLRFIPWSTIAFRIVPLLARAFTHVGIAYFKTNAIRFIEFFSWAKRRAEELHAYR